ncbi:hypothetical protein T8J41_18785 [Nitratireductor rhodophyticola]|uniref:hypothetical protein n=1 Tax=Nitratireductor rhodophyticola TaxID=2854036 RepID=UPI002AC9BB88|nr:hypothetical protein [Nitratireductor rhodophyticola]WPZ14150.1 hypothetical protein T8J41_18785 [Nitratireductor rhodophyticola]
MVDAGEDAGMLAARMRGEAAWFRLLAAAARLELALKYNPGWHLQPRVPAGNPGGGRWTDGGTGSGAMGQDKAPVLQGSADRKRSIIKDAPAVFEVEANSEANGSKPIYELHEMNEVFERAVDILKEASAQDADHRLVMAIVCMETSHGYYDRLHPRPKTVLPMNVHVSYWLGFGWSREDLQVPATNIRAGVTLLKRISERVKEPTVAKVATLYNNLSAEQASGYGARVQKIYEEEPWWDL